MYLKALFKTLLFSVAILVVHFGISLLINQPDLNSLLLIHLVLFCLTYGGFCLLLAINKFDPNKLGFVFLAVSTLKLLVSVSLILIMVKVWKNPNVTAIHFAGMYFIYVIFLSFHTFRLLNKK